MASVIEFDGGRSFTFKVMKSLAANRDIKWNNAYEALSTGPGTLNDLVILGRAITWFERILHPTTVWFNSWIVSTGAHDGDPYNPNTFYEEPIDAVGQWARTGNEFLDLDVCFWAQKQVITGRQGRSYFRGILVEGDVNGNGGKFALVSNNEVAPRLVQAIDLSDLDLWFNGGVQVLVLVIIGNNGQYPRPVAGMSPHGVVISKRNHKYFDRRNTTTTPAYEEDEAPDYSAVNLEGLVLPEWDPDPID